MALVVVEAFEAALAEETLAQAESLGAFFLLLFLGDKGDLFECGCHGVLLSGLWPVRCARCVARASVFLSVSIIHRNDVFCQ